MVFVETMYVRYPDMDFNFNLYRLKLDLLVEIVLETNARSEFKWVEPNKALEMDLMPDMDMVLKLVYDL